jgi:feruloyl esterase
MYNDYYSDAGDFMYPGLSPGCEGQVTAVWNQTITGTSLFGMGYLRYFLYDDPKYNYTLYNDTAVQRAVLTNPGQATVTNYNMSAFRDSGAKMIMYHGLADGLIPPRGSDMYYENVLETMGGDIDELQTYFRHFQVPGLQHCWNT